MTVKQNEPKEAQKTLEAFSWEAGRPNPRFRKMLKRQVLAAARQPKLIFIFTNAMETVTKAKWGTLAIAGLAGLLLLGAGGTGAYLYWQNKNNTTPNFISQEEALKRLYLARNASSQAKMNGAEVASANDGSARGDDSEALGMIYQDFDEVLTHYVMSTTNGPKAETCPMFTTYTMGVGDLNTDSYSSDYYSYYSDSVYLSKGVERLGDELEITRVSTDKYSLEYLGGDYAVKFIYPEGEDPFLRITEEELVEAVPVEGVSEPGYGDEGSSNVGGDVVDDMAVAEPTIEDMFGPDAIVDGPIEENGKYYYMVTFEMDGSSCDSIGGVPVSLSSRMAAEDNSEYVSSGVEKVVIRAKIDAEDGLWSKQEVYTNSIADENLVTIVESTNESRRAEPWEVQGLFVFDGDVEIREIQMPDYDYVEPDEKAEIQSADDPVVLLTTAVKGNLNLMDIYVTEYNYDRYSPPNVYGDRDFFPDGEVGDLLFDSYNVQYSGGLYQLSKSGSYYITSICSEGGQDGCFNVTVNVYSGDPETYDMSDAEDLVVYLDGVALNAKLAKVDSLEMSKSVCSSGVDDGLCTEVPGETVPWNSYITLFSRSGYYFEINVSGYSVSENQARGYNRLETLDVSDDALVAALVEEIEAGRGYSSDDPGNDGQPAIVEE